MPMMASTTPFNSPTRRMSYGSYDGSSDGPSLEDREAVLSLNLKGGYLLPHSLSDIYIDSQRHRKSIDITGDVREAKEERINEVIGFYKEK
ncbi:hypothetical protein TWF506_000112 [Arthrobotrys conoides]|uniref:Uncharacterized protein n=1 Tax=Arthrobotrys conoides TaxID=74498 RepID=A0AAN8NF70_9PEZI